jgi:drug/metabolite transporter (DMT)-like permease
MTTVPLIVVRQHVTARKAIAGCWLFVAALLAWIGADTRVDWFMIAAVASAVIAVVGSASTSRWAGGLLMIASLALGAAVILTLFILGSAPHRGGGGEVRTAVVVVGYIGIFVLPLIAMFSFLFGMSHFAPRDEDAADSIVRGHQER